MKTLTSGRRLLMVLLIWLAVLTPYESIIAAAEWWGVPPGLLVAVAYYETGGEFNCEAIRSTRWEYSVGLFQFNQLGGLGYGHTEDHLLDCGYNANLAAKVIKERYEACGDWWCALQPWSVRNLAIHKWQVEGEW